MAGWEGKILEFDWEKIQLDVRGCGFGKLPVEIGGVKPELFVSAGFTGSYLTGFQNWKVTAAVSNVKVDSLIKDVNLIAQVTKADGFSISGSGLVQLNLPGAAAQEMLIALEYDSVTGFKAQGTGRAHVTPAAWGIPPADLDFKWDPSASPKFWAEGRVQGVIQVSALIPGAKGNIPVNAKVGTTTTFSLKGSADVTLPPDLGGMAVKVDLKVDGASGLELKGSASKMDKKLVDLPDAVNNFGIPDLIVDSAAIAVKAQWKSTSAAGVAAVIWVTGRLGSSKAEGVVAYSKSLCAAVKASGSAISSKVIEPAGLKGDPLKQASFLACKDTSILEDAQLPSIPASISPDGKAKDLKSFIKTLPRMSSKAGFSLSAPAMVVKDSKTDVVLKYLGVKSLSVNVNVDYIDTTQDVMANAKVVGHFNTDDSANLESAMFVMNLDGKKTGNTMDFTTKLLSTVQLRLDEQSGSLIKFKGDLNIQPNMDINGALKMEPGLIPVISKRIALASEATKQTQLLVSFKKADLAGNFKLSGYGIMSGRTNLKAGAAGSAISSCEADQDCVVSSFDLDLAVSMKDAFKAKLNHFIVRWDNKLGFANLYSALSGADLSSSVRNGLERWLGTSYLGAIRYQEKQGKKEVDIGAVAKTPMGLELMLYMKKTIGNGPNNDLIQAGYAKGCLGATVNGGCAGMQLMKFDDTAPLRWKEIAANIKSIGWPSPADEVFGSNSVFEWAQKDFPAALKSPDDLAVSTQLRLYSKGMNVQMNVRAKLSAGGSEAANKLMPEVVAAVKVEKGILKLRSTVFLWGLEINIRFQYYLGARIWVFTGYRDKPAEVISYSLEVETNSLMSSVKQAFKAKLGLLYDIAVKLGAFKWLNLKVFKMDAAKYDVNLEFLVVFLGNEAKGDLVIPREEFETVIKTGDWSSMLGYLVQALQQNFLKMCPWWLCNGNAPRQGNCDRRRRSR
eukprot:TRINITY_DN31355_c0_g1_i1.p1 TRINITY_DN31355_c0_g1~~TRINITY_DN31355_c0_g1_i1.p1  ORF type:complete len:997 (-),score=241.16 TRINITY_DN31355_c0_g1_i1:351-3221(-)